MESLDKPPSYSIRNEKLGNHRKFWTVRCRGKFITAFGRKSDAQGWVHDKENHK